METYDWILLAIAVAGLLRVWWERRQDNIEANRQRRMMDIARNL
jgi:hypothetical protein